MEGSHLINSGNHRRVRREGIRGIALSFLLIFAGAALLFFSAGNFSWREAWIYVGFVVIYQVAYVLVLIRTNPSVLNERGKLAKSGTKGFDLVYFISYIPVTYTGLLIAGLDKRFGWSAVPWWTVVIGCGLLVPSFFIGLYALAVNPYFECTVRVQHDRNQVVVRSGPYRYVRHPGYLALIMSLVSVPLILRSWWAALPYGFVIVMVLARTALEDLTLQRELPGYRDYASGTRFRLFPYIW